MYVGREDRHIQRKSKNAKTFILTVVKIDIYTGNAFLQVRIDIYNGSTISQKVVILIDIYRENRKIQFRLTYTSGIGP